MDLPTFKYHPDPLRTGSIISSPDKCQVCGLARAYLYSGPIYAEDGPDAVCPWCIGDGSAHKQFGVEFTDLEGVGGDGDWDAVPPDVKQEVVFRTPGFNGWQQERWYTHCGDAAEFLGPMGKHELETFGPDAVEAIRRESGFDGQQWLEYFNALNRDHGATAYLFRCRHCGILGGYSDRD